jgi:hypothetical protein
LERAGADDVPLVAEPFFGAAQLELQLGQVPAAAILQFDALELVPDPFIRIQVRGIARQPLQV